MEGLKTSSELEPEVKRKKKRKFKWQKNTVFTIVLIFLFFLAVFQAWQLTSLRAAVASDDFSRVSNTNSSLQNLPNMVGGC